MAALDPALVARFREDGYVRTDGLLKVAEIERYGAAIDRAVAARTATDRRTLADKSTYEQSFVQCMRLWETLANARPGTHRIESATRSWATRSTASSRA